MKKTLLSLASVFIGFGAFAQLPASTTPENKKVILEEFTGIKCTYCPDGHLRAEQIRSANPTDVFLINIHAGSYAVPSAGQPDFRTNFGTALAGQSGLTGYPSGTVNRHVFSGSNTALSRTLWSASASTILGQPSYVNVALQADIDVATRVMTVDFEAYFTAAGASSVNINIAVTQNNVEGPQTGASSFNPGNILPNGNYNHGHMLRHLITGQWGDVITTTAMGTTVTKQYMWNIPTDINGVPVEMGNLQVIGYIVEGQQEVVSGNEGPVTFTVPTGTILVDLETENQTVTPTSLCAGSITPKVNIMNNETAACSGYSVSYSLDGGALVTETVSTPLAGGSSIVHTFAAANLSGGGAHSLEFDVQLTSSTELEIVTGNNSSSSSTFMTIAPNSIGSSFTEDFESYSDREEMWDNAAMVASAEHFVISETSFQNIPNALGGYGNSAQSFRHRLYRMAAGVKNEITTFKVDFSGITNSSLEFDYACAGLNDDLTDKLEVFVSSDCGSTWASVFSKSGADLVTGPSTSNTYYPTPTEWATASINLGDLDQTGDAILKFVVTGSGDGNTLYLDNINAFGFPLGVQELFGSNEITLFPNPSVDNSTLSLTSTESKNVTVKVFDTVGKNVLTLNNQALVAGINRIVLHTSGLNNGIYFVEVSSETKSSVVRLVIQK